MMPFLMAFVHVAILAIPMLRTATATAGPVEDGDSCETGDATSTQVASSVLQIRRSAEGGFSCASTTPKYDSVCPRKISAEDCADYYPHCQWGKCLALSQNYSTDCPSQSFADCAQMQIEGNCRWGASVDSCATVTTPKYDDVCPEKISAEDCALYSPHCQWGKCLGPPMEFKSRYSWMCPTLNFAACEDEKECRWGVESEEKPNSTDCDHHIVEVRVKTDSYPDETSWSIRERGSEGNIIEKTGPTDLDAQICVQAGLYEFTIKDSYGDGMCCNQGLGGFVIQLPNKKIDGTLKWWTKTLTFEVEA
jgi:hypothetical protein